MIVYFGIQDIDSSMEMSKNVFELDPRLFGHDLVCFNTYFTYIC